MLSFNDNSSQHALQKSLPADWVSSSLGNSRTLCVGVTDLWSLEHDGVLVFLYGVAMTYARFRVSSIRFGARKLLQNLATNSSLPLGLSLELAELLAAVVVPLAALPVPGAGVAEGDGGTAD